jgi:hypothetical protein
MVRGTQISEFDIGFEQLVETPFIAWQQYYQFSLPRNEWCPTVV